VARLKTASLQSISTSERLSFGAEFNDITRQGFDMIKMLGQDAEADCVLS